MARILSKLGAEIEDSVAAKFPRQRDRVKYMAYFRTLAGSVFAIEQGTSRHINLWVPAQEAAKRAAEVGGAPIKLLPPWPRGRSGAYGRISSLKHDPALRESPLYRVQVRTLGQANRVLEALV